MKPLVSVIVPIYNVEKYLKKCIDSIINQSLKNIEIILVNDGSTDNSGKIIDEYKIKDNRIIVIHKENGGQASARNSGLNIAKGKYIGFIDSDDWIDIDMYQKLYDEIENQSADVCVCGRTQYSENNQLINKIEIKKEIIDININSIEQYITTRLFYKHTVSTCNKLYNKNIIVQNNINFKDVNHVGSEDTLFNYNILCHTNKIATVDDVFYNQLQRNGSTARSYKKGYILRMANLIECMDDYSKKIDDNKIADKIIPSILLFYNQWCLSQIKLYSKKENILENMQDEIINGMNSSTLKKYIKKLIVDNSMISNMKAMGFKLKGILIIRFFMLLCYCKQYKIASKLIINI